MTLQAPFPYFGGKSKVAGTVWQRFGDVRNYIEPFAGSLAVLLGRPQPFAGVETVNDLDGFISNFWRAVKAEPEQVAYHADWPVNENDLHARHAWLVGEKESMQSRLEGNPEWFSAKIAGWWVWGVYCWIGGEFCSGKGPWRVEGADGERLLVKGGTGDGIQRARPHLGNSGVGVKRKLPRVSDAGSDVIRRLPTCGNAGGVLSTSAVLSRLGFRISRSGWKRCAFSVETGRGRARRALLGDTD